jgi:hypothetical protein
MFRWVALIAVALCLSAVTLHAQAPQPAIFTVIVASANIHQSPNNRSPIVGHRSKGESLDVRRDMGNWVEVAWPSSPDGVAYVASNTGLISQPAPPPPVRRPMTISEYVAATSPAPAASGATAAAPTCSCVQSATSATAPAADRAANTTPAMQPFPTYVIPKHSFGIGGQYGGVTKSALGATGRFWSRERIGLQLELTRESKNAIDSAVRLMSQRVASSVIVAPPSTVGDYLWLRPYFGGGITFYHSSFGAPSIALAGESTTENAMGIQMFGGGELTFASVPRFALSADFGYHKWPASFEAFGPRKLALKLSGHWYVR